MTERSKTTICIVVTPKVGLTSITLFYEAFRAANRFCQSPPFEFYITSADGRPVLASNGFEIPVTMSVAEVKSANLVCLIASYEQTDDIKSLLFDKLRKLARHGAALCAIDHGVLMLAEAGLVGDRRIAAHWEYLPALAERWPGLNVTEDIYCIDRNLMTTCGHTASLDLALAYISSCGGSELAKAVANELISSGIRAPNTPQRQLKHLEPWSEQPVLRKVVVFMKMAIDQPQTISEFARRAGVSRRQLEYLTKRHLQCSPMQFYLRLRLHRARELLLHTSNPISGIASACGFSTVSGFSRSFSLQFGSPPSIYRERFKTTMMRPYLS